MEGSDSDPAEGDRIAPLFSEANSLLSEYEDWQDRRDANREALRNLARAGILNGEEKERVDELYPYRASYKGSR